jgi:transposase-like protein
VLYQRYKCKECGAHYSDKQNLTKASKGAMLKVGRR